MPGSWVDFDHIKRTARFETVLEHYGLEPIGRGSQRFILCPFHQEKTPSYSIDLRKRIFHCFGCGAKGTIIGFVAKVERTDLRTAALKLLALSALPDTGREATRQNGDPITSCRADIRTLPNTPIRPLTLDPTHPYLTERGLTPEQIEFFGLGYSSQGYMRGRICFPIHNAEGTLVAYAGRWACDIIPGRTPRYLLSRGFRKRGVLFNLHRVAPGKEIVLVEGYWSAVRLHSMGLPVAALMGSSIYEEQIGVLRARAVSKITVLMDGDEAGYKGREQIVRSLSRAFHVRAPILRSRQKPDTLPTASLFEFLEPRADLAGP